MSSIDARILKHLPAVRDSPPFDLDLHYQTHNGISVILGPSGSGKTLLLNCIGGFVRPDEGRILVHDQLYFDGETNIHLPSERRRCGYIFQEHALFPHMTVRENLRFAASLPASKTSRINLHRQVNELLDAFNLNQLGGRKPAQLSGGEKQRAALARILITQPRVLLLDEPSRGLDASLRQSFYETLRSVRERIEAPILLVSHDIEECFELADYVAVLDKGRLLRHGARAAVLEQPATVEVARLLAVFNIAPAEIRALDPGANTSRVRIFAQEIDGPYFPGHLIGDSGYLCVRRSEMRLMPVNANSRTGYLSLRVQARHASTHGVRILLENDFSITVREAEDTHADRLDFTIPAAAMTFLSR